MIGVVDYGMGNLRSVLNAFEAICVETCLIKNPEDFSKADSIVLPGVGAFGNGMKNLHQKNFIDELNDHVLHKKKPFLGICLGMQLLATKSNENAEFYGLDWISGHVDRLSPDVGNNQIRVPHIGWNDVDFYKKDGLYKNIEEPGCFYFVHSYVLKPKNPLVLSGVCEHGEKFAASIEFKNIWATQFHPEKSHKFGLKLLKNWHNFTKEC